MTISEYFLRVKSLCSEISKIDDNEKISESRLRRYLIRGFKKEYVPFITSIQGWTTQPTVEELENLLSNQEALAKQMAKGFENDSVLFSKRKNYKKGSSSKEKEEESISYKGCNYEKKPHTCYKCGKVGHIKRDYRSKVTKANVACTSNDDVKWEQCFTVDTVVKKNQWIIDSGFSHHVTGDGTLLHDVRDHNQNRVVITADNSTHPVKKEGNAIIDVNNNTFTLEDVYLVPKLTKNIVLVPQITESGKHILFGPTDVKVLENVKEIVGDVLFTGEKKGSLFVLSAVYMPATPPYSPPAGESQIDADYDGDDDDEEEIMDEIIEEEESEPEKESEPTVVLAPSQKRKEPETPIIETPSPSKRLKHN
ncbi:uncharacterized protein [Rutidosis leptorrhynchoides]|uniref:uncharacterized protein n=1 Tax=Rutidosis leptorrhynchoides TaxID=125765 RepID=UPI003A9A5E60